MNKVSMTKMVAIPFMFQAKEQFVLMRFRNREDYRRIRPAIVQSRFYLSGNGIPVIAIPNGYLIMDTPVATDQHEELKRRLVRALDDFFTPSQPARHLGIEALFSAS